LILAAGRGRRLGAITDNTPKCLVPLAGRALLDWQLAALRLAGVTELAVVRGYRGTDVDREGLTYFENRSWAESNMVASLCCAGEWLRAAPCLLSYSDIVYHPHVLRPLLQAPHEICIAYDQLWHSLWQMRFEHPEHDAESFSVVKGRLADIGRKRPALESVQGQYMGLLKITPKGWAQIESLLSGLQDADLRTLDVTSLLRRLLIQGIEIGAVPVQGRWCELDRPEDLELYEKRIREASHWTHDWRF